MCLAGRHQCNGKADNTGNQLRRAVAKAIFLKKGANWMEVLPANVRAPHVTTDPSGYTPSEIVFGTHNVLRGLLLQCQGRLPKLLCIISKGVRSSMLWHIGL